MLKGRTSAQATRKKSDLLALAASGAPRPAGGPLYYALRNYTVKGGLSYDADFVERLDAIAPSHPTWWPYHTQMGHRLLVAAALGQECPIGWSTVNVSYPEIKDRLKNLAPQWWPDPCRHKKDMAARKEHILIALREGQPLTHKQQMDKHEYASPSAHTFDPAFRAAVQQIMRARPAPVVSRDEKKERRLAYQAKWRDAHPDYQRKWQAEHKRLVTK